MLAIEILVHLSLNKVEKATEVFAHNFRMKRFKLCRSIAGPHIDFDRPNLDFTLKIAGAMWKYKFGLKKIWLS